MNISTVSEKRPVFDAPVAKKKNSHILLKLAGIFFLLLTVAGLFVPVYFRVGENGLQAVNGCLAEIKLHSPAVEGGKSVFTYFLAYFASFFQGGVTFPKFVLALTSNKIALGIMIACGALAVLNVFTVLKTKYAPLLFKIQGIVYLIVLLVYGYHSMIAEPVCFDLIHISAALAFLAVIVDAFAEGKKKTVGPFVCFLLLTVATALTASLPFTKGADPVLIGATKYFQGGIVSFMMFVYKGTPFAFPQAAPYQLAANIAIFFLILNLVFTYFQMGTFRNNVFTTVRYALQFVLTVVSFVLAVAVGGNVAIELIPCLLFTVFIVLACILSVTLRVIDKKKKQPASLLINPVSKNVTETVEEPAEEVVETVEEPAAEVAETVEEPVEEVAETVEEPAAEIAETVEEPAAEVVETVEGPAAEVTETVDEPAAEIVETVDEPAAEIVETVEEPAAEVTETVDEPAAEIVETVDEPAAEIAETVEEPAAEVVESVEEPAAEVAETVEEPAAEVAETVEETKKAEPFVAFAVQYDRSFQARLIQSDEELQARYSAVKNALLSYRKTRCRTSWKYESFCAGRKTIARLVMRGKTLNLYLALPPAGYEESKYFFEDAGEANRYAAVPMRLKLRSNRSVKWALELIADLAAEFGLEKLENAETNEYRYAYRSDEELLAEGLIRISQTRLPAENAADEETEPLEEVAETVEDPAEEVAEEVSEEVKEEIAVMEEVSAAEVDEIMTDEQAKTRIAEAETKSDRKNRGIVNVDVLNACFEDGETVTLQEIKKRVPGIPKKWTYIKVLARGKMNKALTVCADEFSIEAVKMILLTGGKVLKTKK